LAFIVVSVVRVREFRARGSGPVICHLSFELCHLPFEILLPALTFFFGLQHCMTAALQHWFLNAALQHRISSSELVSPAIQRAHFFS
jgi:hypothetical protein